jgi:Domain of unknown function (DUF4845)
MATRITDLVTLPPVRGIVYRVKQVLTALAVLLAVYVTWIVMPIYFAQYRFEDAIQTKARTAAYNDQDEEEIHNEIMQQARELGIPVKEENLHVERGENVIRIDATYDVPIRLLQGHVVTLTFAPSSAEKTLTHAAIQVKKIKESK